jgi:hypothetical protein
LRKVHEARQAIPSATISANAKGGMTVTDRPPRTRGTTSNPELDQLKSNLQLELSNQRKAKPEKQADFVPRIRTIRQRIAEHEKAADTNAAPASSAAPTSSFDTPESVRAAFKAGTLPRAEAESILRHKFGHQ